MLACAAGLLFLLRPAGSLPGFSEVKRGHVGSEFVLLDRKGEILQEMRSDAQARRLDWIDLENISPALRSAMLFAEDKRFYGHHGVDWFSLAGALVSGLRSPGLRGASTVTMQLAARLEEDLRPRSHRRTLLEKVAQIRTARRLEETWSKNEIFEAYLNLITFRGELQGISAASEGLFRKAPQGLNESESLLLASLVRSPNSDPARVVDRALLLNESLGWHLDRTALAAEVRSTLSQPYWIRPKASLAPHIALRLMRAEDGPGSRSTVSTLDAGLQRFATEILRRHILAVRPQNVRDGAVLVVENRSGEVLVYIGNPGEFSSARFVDGIQARRQAGSTLKPFVYGLAFDQHLLTPASIIDDSPLEVPVEGGTYRPRNYDQLFHGQVTARIALASSLNVPAVKTLNLVGTSSVIDLLSRLGLRQLRGADFYGPSLALGAADVTLWDMVNAYRTLANGGLMTPLRISPAEPEQAPIRVLSEGPAFLISEILSDRESRSETFSLENPLSTRFWTAVKTGTSKDMRDNWCIGYSERYTVGVWVGNFSGEAMWNVTGMTGAAPVWIEIMNRLHDKVSSLPPQAPTGVLARLTDVPSAGVHRREWFLEGTETSVVSAIAGQADAKISYPAPGTVIALDPDIPAQQQKLFFEARPESRNFRWVLDGIPAGTADTVYLWTPVPGKHTLSLTDERNAVLDSVVFEVRGKVQI
jgi:penicillin-binding protein 1C